MISAGFVFSAECLRTTYGHGVHGICVCICKLTYVQNMRAREPKMQTHQVHFPVRYAYERSGDPVRERSQQCSNIFRCAGHTRIRTREKTAASKHNQQHTRAGQGPERNVYAATPASHIVTTEYHVAHACVEQNQCHIQRDIISDPNKVIAEPCVPNVTFALGRDVPQKYR